MGKNFTPESIIESRVKYLVKWNTGDSLEKLKL
jgi:hypothetical protein